MNYSKISIRYAKALFELALEEKNIDRIYEDMMLISEVISSVSTFTDMLEHPVIENKEKIHLFESIFKRDVSYLTIKLFNLLVKNKRENYLKDIARNYKNIFKKHKGIKEAEFTTAYDIDRTYISNIEKIISNEFKSKIDLHTKIDKSIIGGFILRVEDKQINTSVSHKLNKIKNEFKNTSLS